ncbi:hypothetical protein TKK_0018683 [Trichogramma kaykai]|uniref:Uncharacterized protein n=1 Tax=Trichogramma kaykai TaxID=54128 RepID=A0ABD2VX39_9HYME
MDRPLITLEYLRQKIGAVDLIKLVEFLTKKKVKDHHLEIDGTVKLILRHGMKTTANANLKDCEVDEFKKTLLNFKMDDWKKTNLYRINHGVLLVACVEHVLAPNINNEKLMKIYRCDARSAKMLYKKLLRLCGIEKEINPDIVESAKSFFRCRIFSTEVGFLDTIRSYLNTIDINDEEKIYIRNTSIQLIDNTETINDLPLQRTIDTVPLQRSDNTETINIKRLRKCTINQEYFQNKSKAHVIINLVKYLKENNIQKDNLKKTTTLIEILREGMKKFIKDDPSEKQLEPFQKILTARIDMWKAAHLYRVNYGILAVACVERVLYPGKSNEEYKKIYDGDDQKATELYKELCNIPKEKQLDPAIVKSAASFFQCTKKCLDSIRRYLEEIKIDFEEMEYIKKTSIELIKNNEHELSTNMIEPIKYHKINVPINKEQPNAPMIEIIYPNIPSLNVDPPSMASIPVDQELIISNKDEQSTNMMEPIEYRTINVPINNEQPNPPMIEITYPDIPSLNVNPTSLASIPVDQELIISNQNEQSTNMNDPIECYTINVPVNDEQPHPPMPDMSALNVDPTSLVSIPVDQELIISNQDEQSTNMNNPTGYYIINVPFDADQPHPPMPNMSSLNVDSPSVASIPVNQELIISNQDEQSTNMNNPTEYYIINVPFDDDQPHAPMSSMSSLNVDSSSVASIPVDQELIISNQDEESTNMNDPIEDHLINVPCNDEQLNSPEPDVSMVRVYVPSTSMVDLSEYNYPILMLCDDEHLSSSTPNASTVNLFSKVSIPVDQGLIKSNEDKSPTNIINLTEEQPSTSSVVSPENSNSCLIDQLVARLPHGISDFIDEQAENLPTIDELNLPSMQDVPSVNVDPPSVVSPLSVNQGFLSRYAPNDVVLARMSDSNFWPAKITQVQDDVMSVEFFSLLDKKTEVSSEEDLKDFTNDLFEEVAASLNSDTLRESFKLALESAYDFKFSY